MSYEKYRHQLLHDYPAVSDLAQRAKERIPDVAWQYLIAGTGEEQLLQRNRDSLNAITLPPQFCQGALTPDLTTTLFEQKYDAPFGVAPVGLTGLMWPRAEVLLAQAAAKRNIPFSLSTVATETPETLAPHIGETGWFQLYPPREKELRESLMDRALEAGFKVLLITADVPTPSRRERTKRAGLQMPPKITPAFIWQGITHPVWTWHTLRRGLPKLRTVASYSQFQDMMSVGKFVRSRLGGNLSWEICEEIKTYWPGPVVLKGVLHPQDAERAIAIGLDGVVVSNHGGRQFDAAPAAIDALPEIVRVAKGKTAILMDSGVRTGLDILRAMSLGADFILLGRAFLFGVAALGEYGGEHVIEILRDDLQNNMIQLGVERLSGLPTLL
ncbi:MAG: alpha-hydroxy acid oxidase [Bacteroidota bacterium]